MSQKTFFGSVALGEHRQDTNHAPEIILITRPTNQPGVIGSLHCASSKGLVARNEDSVLLGGKDHLQPVYVRKLRLKILDVIAGLDAFAGDAPGEFIRGELAPVLVNVLLQPG